MPRELLIATHNADKLREIGRLLAPVGWRVRAAAEAGMTEAPIEDADTFEGNARIKALAGWRASGLPSVGDDSGLCVDALGGTPGVYSSRFGGRAGDHEANNRLLLQRLEGVPEAARTARFVTTLVMAWGPDAPPAVLAHPTHTRIDGAHVLRFEGTVEGRIALAPRGTQGFGYDPIFIPVPPARSGDEGPDGRHLAEYGLDEKNAISHRGVAFRALAAFLLALDNEAGR